MKILIVSGFLGAGKTTFIKELIRRTGQDIVILENEYGDTDIDKGWSLWRAASAAPCERASPTPC